MRVRVLVSLAAACCFGLPAVSAAATPCKPLLTDPAGDTQSTDWPGPVHPPLNEAALDILAIDLKSDTRTLTVSVRLAEVDRTPVPHRLLTVLLESGKNLYQAYWYIGADEERFVFTNERGDHDVRGTADAKSGLVRFQVPRTLLPKAVRRVSAEGNSAVIVGDNASGDVYYYDIAGSRRLYTLGTRGCL